MKDLLLIGLVTAALATSVDAAEVGGVGVTEFQQQCRAAFDEPWRTIPWKTSLLEAQHLAAKEKKPIFIWAMDGHPLGCT